MNAIINTKLLCLQEVPDVLTCRHQEKGLLKGGLDPRIAAYITDVELDGYSSPRNTSMSLHLGPAIPKPYSRLGNSGTVYVKLHGTQVHETQVQGTQYSSFPNSSTRWHFLIPKIQLSQCHASRLTKNSSSLDSSII